MEKLFLAQLLLFFFLLNYLFYRIDVKLTPTQTKKFVDANAGAVNVFWLTCPSLHSGKYFFD